MTKSRGHVEAIDGYEYYRMPDGRLFRAPIDKPIGDDGRRAGVELALRPARMS